MRIGMPVCGLVAAIGVAGGIELLANQSTDDVAYSPELAAMNIVLNTVRPDIAIDRAELLYAYTPPDAATTIIANDRTHLIGSQFVENDPRRGSPLNTLTYLVDQSEGSALSWLTVPGGPIVVLPNAVTEPEIDASMAAWLTVPCGGPAFAKVADSGADPDLIDGLVFGNPGLIGTPFADITHAGWLPRAFFDLLAPGGGTSILGVTFTFVFVDENGIVTDINGDGFADVAFREIYYNLAFPWGTGGNDSNVDIQSVSIHESGHALGLGHFGKVFIKNNGALQFAPKAIMNAVYISEDRAIRGTDRGSFCQVWANGK